MPILVFGVGLSSSAVAEYQFVPEPWGSPGPSNGQFQMPVGIASDGLGTVYVVDAATSAARVQRFDSDGTFLSAFRGPGNALDAFATAGHVAADASGSVYVTDPDNARVEKFTADGAYLFSWGSQGDGEGLFQRPSGIATDVLGNVWVVDEQTDRVQRFTPEGAPEKSWFGRFVTARDVAVDVFGDVYVLDGGADRVEKFSAEGRPLPGWGSTGSGPGQFIRPSGIATDRSGNVFVADTGNQRVQVFNADGAHITTFGNSGVDPGAFIDPVDVASDITGSVYVVDQGNSRVQKFAEPTPPLPPPELGETANVDRVTGRVLVRLPGESAFASLTDRQHIPLGSVVQARSGRVRLTTARDARGRQQTALFYAGEFVVTQLRTQPAVTQLELTGRAFDGCRLSREARGARRRKRSRRVVRQLWGDGKGEFRTTGHDAAAGVRGTKWLTQDRCDGTLVRVERGKVAVRDFVLRKTFVVEAGHSHLAKRR
jgi:sugar lactone lactonase YvrE